MLSRLHAAGVDYLLTGSMASNYWGIPRTTHDLDFVARTEATIRCGAPRGLGVRCWFLHSTGIRNRSRPFQTPIPIQRDRNSQSALKADFWLFARQNAFEQTAFGRRLQVMLFAVSPRGSRLPRTSFFANSIGIRLAPCERQLGDAAGVYAVQSDSLDVGCLPEMGGTA